MKVLFQKNIEKRAKDLEIIQAKELKEYETFVKEFHHNLALLKDKISNDPMEQLFIDLIKNCKIKHKKYPFVISLLKDGIWMFDYDWKNDIIWCSYDNIWTFYKYKFKMSYEEIQQFINNQIEKYFNFKASIIANTNTPELYLK